MKKKISIILLCVFIFLAFSTAASAEDINNQTAAVNGISETHIVDGSSKNQMSDPTIQTAINNAKSGDTIEITGTDYEHCHFVIDKKLNIISTVGTTLSTCPSNTQGSDGIGIFYITPEASGTVISGFTIINEEYKSGTVNPYGIYINGAKDVTIENCTIEKVSKGPGIYIKDSTNTLINNCIVKNSVKGIYLDNSPSATINNNIVKSNSNAGIYVINNCPNLYIKNNTIKSNNYYGIYLGYAYNTFILSNIIEENRNNVVSQRADQGVGIYVDTTVTNLQILGNFISSNGLYGIYDSPKFTNMADQYVQIVNGNYFMNHMERAIFHANPEGYTDVVYVWSNYYVNELFCGGTSYEPGILISNHERDLKMSNITEIKNGVYSVSFVRADTGEIATDLNTVNVTFFLNKNNTSATPKEGEIYKTVRVVNGTAIVDFRNETYLSTGNNITAVGLGSGIITYRATGSRPSQIFFIEDSHIPNGEIAQPTIIGNDITKYFKNDTQYCVKCVDNNGNILKNIPVTFNIIGKNYTVPTNDEGIATLTINLNPGTYTITTKNSQTNETCTNIVTVLSSISGNDIVKYYRNETQYQVKVLDFNGNPLTNKKVTFNIIGKFYDIETNNEGIAVLPINLNPGEYRITATNPNDNLMFSNTIKVLSSVSGNNMVKYYRNGTQYQASFVDSQGKALANKNVTFNIIGKFYTITTDSNGVAVLPINLNPGEYIVTALNPADNLMYSNTIKVLPIIIENKDITMTSSNKVSYTIKVLYSQGKAAVNQDVTFNINGNIYHVKSDENGIASLNINFPKGKYIISSTYNYYTVSNTIIIN